MCGRYESSYSSMPVEAPATSTIAGETTVKPKRKSRAKAAVTKRKTATRKTSKKTAV